MTITNDDGPPLRASEARASGASAATALTAAQLDPIVARAEQAWIAARPGAHFSGLTVSIGDLDGLLLGVAGIGTITIDANAAGWGWTINGGEMDLLTVVMHELGHVLGLDHDDVAGGLMGERLAPGSAYRLAGPCRRSRRRRASRCTRRPGRRGSAAASASASRGSLHPGSRGQR